MVVWVLTEARYAYPSSEAPSLPPYVQNVLNEDFAGGSPARMWA